MIKIHKEELTETTQNTSIHTETGVVKHIKLSKDKSNEEEQINKLKKFFNSKE